MDNKHALNDINQFLFPDLVPLRYLSLCRPRQAEKVRVLAGQIFLSRCWTTQSKHSIKRSVYEPWHNETNKMSVRPAKDPSFLHADRETLIRLGGCPG